MERKSKHKVICQSANGRVIYCHCCEISTLEFRNILWKFKRNTLADFLQLIKSFDKEYMISKQKRIFLKLPNSEVSLGFNHQELAELEQMAETAKLFAEKEYLEKIFHKD